MEESTIARIQCTIQLGSPDLGLIVVCLVKSVSVLQSYVLRSQIATILMVKYFNCTALHLKGNLLTDEFVDLYIFRNFFYQNLFIFSGSVREENMSTQDRYQTNITSFQKEIKELTEELCQKEKFIKELVAGKNPKPYFNFQTCFSCLHFGFHSYVTLQGFIMIFSGHS